MVLGLVAAALVVLALLLTMPLASLASARVGAPAGGAVAIAEDGDCDVETNDIEEENTFEATHATMFKNSSLHISETSVRFLKPDVAIARSEWELVGHTDPQGETLPLRKGMLTNVMKEDGGRWSIVASQNTNLVPVG